MQRLTPEPITGCVDGAGKPSCVELGRALGMEVGVAECLELGRLEMVSGKVLGLGLNKASGKVGQGAGHGTGQRVRLGAGPGVGQGAVLVVGEAVDMRW